MTTAAHIPTDLVGSTIPRPRDETAREVTDGRVLDQLADTVIRDLFGLGLTLQTVLPFLSGDPAQRLNAAIDDTDRIIRHIRNAVFAPAELHEPPSSPCEQ